MEIQSDLTKTRLGELKSEREKASLETEDDRHEFLLKLNPIIQKWMTVNGRREEWNDVPNLRDVFGPGEIELLLKTCMNLIREDQNNRHWAMNFIKLVPGSGYRDKHEDGVDEDGNPVLLRDTLLHHLARHEFYGRDAVAAELFKIYDRYDRNYIGAYVTHFEVACMTGCLEVVKKFIELGQDASGSKPLFLAAKYNQIKVIRLLVEHGADPNSTDLLRNTPLHAVCARDDDNDLASGAVALIRSGAKIGRPVQVDARGHLNRTPLHVAAIWSNSSCVRKLLQEGADPNATDSCGSTVLHRICMSSELPKFGEDKAMVTVRELFEIAEEKERPVLVNVRDNDGRTPLDLAWNFLNPRMIEFLTAKGAIRSTPPPSDES